MAHTMVVRQGDRQELAATILPADEHGKYLNQSSDLAAFTQLLYHGGCAAIAALVVHYSLQADSIKGLIAGELMLGFVSSFYFTAFHEFIHNTAFATKWINMALSHLVGVSVFRGANWFWSFHWLHHRYTQDPEKDPELSGGSSDLMDPSKGVLMYMRFLSGWPFGFERVWKMVRMGLGLQVDPWVEEAGFERIVQVESVVYVLIYAAFAVGAFMNDQVRAFVIWYWLLPHILGAGHLRFYQFAEHRACENGHYTDLDAWGSARTSSAWFFYRRLAWNMPFHIEHHAWPQVPFHLLPEVHERIKSVQPENRCLISGNAGHFGVHVEFLRRVVKGEATSLPPVERQHEEKGDAPKCINRLGDAEAMGKLPRFSLEEVQKNGWVTILGVVIDASSFLQDHPGGADKIVNMAGKDATKLFKMIHREGTLQSHLPDECIIGVLTGFGAGGLGEPLLNNSLAQP